MTKPEPIRILYMEDDAGLARLLQKKLERAGYAVTLAHDGAEGLALYDAAQYDVVAVDQNMPVHDGLQVIRILAARGPLPPIIMVTGSGNEQIAVEAMKLGAGNYIVKDMNGGYLELLPSVIDQVLHQHRLEEEKRAAEEAEREQRALAEALRDTAAALNSTLEFDQVLDRILANVGRVVSHDAASIMLIDAGQGTARVHRCHGYVERGVSAEIYLWQFKIADFAGLRTMTEMGQPVIIPDTHADPDWVRLSGTDWQRSYVGAPICVKGQVFGVMNLDSATPGFFTLIHADRLQAFADQAAIAIENARLYDQAHRHASELEQQAMELQARNEELDAFAHTVAHDLKTPVGPIIGFAEVLARDYAVMSEDERLQSLQAIVRSGRKMNMIIEELLLLAQVRKTEVETTPVDMATIVSEARQRLADTAEQSHAEIVLPDASAWPVVLGYALWMEEVWVNYLSNAIKYGGRPPHIELGAEAQPDGMVRFWVRDNGPGIPPEAQARLFKPFTRLDQVRTKGHGLGLSIVRRIVEKLGGQVSVESRAGQGSVFSFTLPAG